MIKKTFFVSGHRDITKEEFEQLYIPKFKEIIDSFENGDIDPFFIMGDYEGVDIMSQNALVGVLRMNPARLTVYHMNSTPMNLNSEITNLKGNFKDDIERDSAMTRDSDEDIAFVRIGKECSGTAQNIIRRKSFINENNKIKMFI